MNVIEICARLEQIGIKPRRLKRVNIADKVEDWYSSGSSWYRDTARLAGEQIEQIYGALIEKGYDAKDPHSKACCTALESALTTLYGFMESYCGKQRDGVATDNCLSAIEELKREIDRTGRSERTMSINAKETMKETIKYLIDALDYASTEEYEESNKAIIAGVQGKLRAISDQLTGVVDVATKQAADRSNKIFALVNDAVATLINGEYGSMDAQEALDKALELAKDWVTAPIPKIAIPGSESALKDALALDNQIKNYALAAPSKRRLADALTRIGNRMKAEDQRLEEAAKLEKVVAEDQKLLAQLQAKIAEISARHKAGMIDAVTAKNMCDAIIREATPINNRILARQPDIIKRRKVAEASRSLINEIYCIFDNAGYYANSADMTVRIASKINFNALTQVLSGNLTAESKNSIVNLQELCELIGNAIQMSAEDVLAEIGKSRIRTKLDNETEQTVNNPFSSLTNPAVSVDNPTFVSNDQQASAESFMANIDAMLSGAGTFAGAGDIGAVTVDTTVNTDEILLGTNGNGNGGSGSTGSAGSDDI